VCPWHGVAGINIYGVAGINIYGVAGINIYGIAGINIYGKQGGIWTAEQMSPTANDVECICRLLKAVCKMQLSNVKCHCETELISIM
jgi:hypothetical protein